MTNTVSYFEIQADDCVRAVDFYGKVFDWEFTKEENLPVEYYRIKTDGMNGGLLKRPAPKPAQEQGTNAFVCSVQVEDFDSIAEKIFTKWWYCCIRQICSSWEYAGKGIFWIQKGIHSDFFRWM
jgi:predicted enzyme related to lactoylglutathione lyase